MNEYFQTAKGVRCSGEEVVSEIKKFMETEPSFPYKLIIGTDSQVIVRGDHKHSGLADFVTAIVIHRVGNGGRYFWRRIGREQMPTLRNRMYQEVLYSIEVAKELFAYLATTGITVDSEIHIDVGRNGETSVMIQELVGMIRANNFEVKTKPESYAASKVADRHV